MGFINKNVNLADCLKSTKMCDSAHPFITQKAQSLTKMADTDKEKAKAIFYYIRDSIEFFMDPYFSTASDTLRNVRGFCVSKSNLQVAMLRAINIPAIYHVVHLKIGSIAPFFPKWIIRNFPSVIDHHPICECFIDDKWIACDTTLDRSLIDMAKKNGYLDQANFPEIDWDGENGREIFNPWKVGEEGYFANLDSFWKDTLKRRYSPLFMVKIAMHFGNKYLASMRRS